MSPSNLGGSNPALRNLYYRLLRLLSLSVQALFVFDGPNKPSFKRNRHVGTNAACLPDFLAKALLKLFGFPFHMAPGEAEAECARLQQEGVVDAVLSEDVDTLMFGCGLSLRNWSSEEARGKSPTHVSVYDAEKIRTDGTGLNGNGMVLVALMSGGDYIPEGIPRCGIKVACEAAKAGFGQSLCALSTTDEAGLNKWREQLRRELQTNEGRHFKVKHKALQIPDSFPDKTVLRYYTHPVVSSKEEIQSLRRHLNWEIDADLLGLREFVADAFEWRNRSGARKFIRGLAPALMVQRLGRESEQIGRTRVDITTHEEGIIRSVCNRRVHFSTDGIPELRVAYIPIDIVPLDLDAEAPDDEINPGQPKATEEDMTSMTGSGDEDVVQVDLQGPSTTRKSPAYDPTIVDKRWVLDAFVRHGAPKKVFAWEEGSRIPKKPVPRQPATKRATTKGGMKPGALDPYVKVTKPGLPTDRISSTKDSLLSRDALGQMSSMDVPSPPMSPSTPWPRSTQTQATPQTVKRSDGVAESSERSESTQEPAITAQDSSLIIHREDSIGPTLLWTITGSLTRRRGGTTSTSDIPTSDAASVPLASQKKRDRSESSTSTAELQSVLSSDVPRSSIPTNLANSSSHSEQRAFGKPCARPLSSLQSNISDFWPSQSRPEKPTSAGDSTGESNGLDCSSSAQAKRSNRRTFRRVSTYPASGADSRPVRPVSPVSDGSLPSPSALVSPAVTTSATPFSSRPSRPKDPVKVITLLSSPLTPVHHGQARAPSPSPSALKASLNPKVKVKTIALRESLEGTWKIVDDDDGGGRGGDDLAKNYPDDGAEGKSWKTSSEESKGGRGGNKVWQDVEVVDLSGG